RGAPSPARVDAAAPDPTCEDVADHFAHYVAPEDNLGVRADAHDDTLALCESNHFDAAERRGWMQIHDAASHQACLDLRAKEGNRTPPPPPSADDDELGKELDQIDDVGGDDSDVDAAPPKPRNPRCPRSTAPRGRGLRAVDGSAPRRARAPP